LGNQATALAGGAGGVESQRKIPQKHTSPSKVPKETTPEDFPEEFREAVKKMISNEKKAKQLNPLLDENMEYGAKKDGKRLRQMERIERDI
jgi:hypothetical protein